MSNKEMLLQGIGDELYRALRQVGAVEPLTERYPALSIEDAYAIQHACSPGACRTASVSSARRSA